MLLGGLILARRDAWAAAGATAGLRHSAGPAAWRTRGLFMAVNRGPAPWRPVRV